ncbi:hypothetical protein H8S90_13750 [Olivibacter sp. SDN3]|uniref:hypothetical protein n=1 Tax=Olivibacter sp. SDN3 TaxID=2764720 RepID=UPI001651A467|nr:hypothetical protein [Olivibacter sp. SDN3]QNL47883.1 hypothetical protein H8S90_13750 [Olivibacter sp. SDN3]
MECKDNDCLCVWGYGIIKCPNLPLCLGRLISVHVGLPNIEFEQALFHDIVTNTLSAFSRGTQDQKDAYESWIDQITENRTKAPKAYQDLGGQYFEFMEIWKNFYPEYDRTIKNDLNPEAMLNVLQNSGCY